MNQGVITPRINAELALALFKMMRFFTVTNPFVLQCLSSVFLFIVYCVENN